MLMTSHLKNEAAMLLERSKKGVFEGYPVSFDSDWGYLESIVPNFAFLRFAIFDVKLQC